MDKYAVVEHTVMPWDLEWAIPRLCNGSSRRRTTSLMAIYFVVAQFKEQRQKNHFGAAG